MKTKIKLKRKRKRKTKELEWYSLNTQDTDGIRHVKQRHVKQWLKSGSRREGEHGRKVIDTLRKCLNLGELMQTEGLYHIHGLVCMHLYLYPL